MIFAPPIPTIITPGSPGKWRRDGRMVRGMMHRAQCCCPSCVAGSSVNILLASVTLNAAACIANQPVFPVGFADRKYATLDAAVNTTWNSVHIGGTAAACAYRTLTHTFTGGTQAHKSSADGSCADPTLFTYTATTLRATAEINTTNSKVTEATIEITSTETNWSNLQGIVFYYFRSHDTIDRYLGDALPNYAGTDPAGPTNFLNYYGIDGTAVVTFVPAP